jgi:hypothetical protein
VLPRTTNRLQLKLPKVGRDKNVDTAKGKRGYDYVIIPKISVALETAGEGKIFYRDSGVSARNVHAWLGGDRDAFVVGMSFLNHLDVTMKREGRIILRK